MQNAIDRVGGIELFVIFGFVATIMSQCANLPAPPATGTNNNFVAAQELPPQEQKTFSDVSGMKLE